MFINNEIFYKFCYSINASGTRYLCQYMNTSKEKKEFNLKVKLRISQNGKQKIVFYASKDILANQELIWDYGERRSCVVERFLSLTVAAPPINTPPQPPTSKNLPPQTIRINLQDDTDTSDGCQHEKDGNSAAVPQICTGVEGEEQQVDVGQGEAEAWGGGHGCSSNGGGGSLTHVTVDVMEEDQGGGRGDVGEEQAEYQLVGQSGETREQDSSTVSLLQQEKDEGEAGAWGGGHGCSSNGGGGSLTDVNVDVMEEDQGGGRGDVGVEQGDQQGGGHHQLVGQSGETRERGQHSSTVSLLQEKAEGEGVDQGGREGRRDRVTSESKQYDTDSEDEPSYGYDSSSGDDEYEVCFSE